MQAGKKACSLRIVVKASLAGLTIERRSPWRTRTTLIAAPDLLDLDCSTTEGAIESVKTVSGMPVAPGGTTERMFANLKKWVPAKGIIVKSREEMVAFGEGLPAAELRYLRSVLRKKLAGR
jgi:hypothetical protein